MDPLDGTKEFIKRNGEFTVNIALIDHGKPILGVVYAPVMNVMYSAAEGKAWKEECGVRKQIQVRDARPPLVMLWLQLPERTFTTGRVNRWITLRASRS